MSFPASTNRLEDSASTECDVSPAFRAECIQFFGDLVVQLFGLGRSLGQIYGLLFASPRPLSFTDIAETLDISRGSASQGLHALRSLGAVRCVVGDDRRERFEPEKGLRKLVTGVLREKVDPLVMDANARLARLREQANAAPDEAGRKFSLERVKQIESWRRQMGMMLPVLKTILGPGRA